MWNVMDGPGRSGHDSRSVREGTPCPAPQVNARPEESQGDLNDRQGITQGPVGAWKRGAGLMRQ